MNFEVNSEMEMRELGASLAPSWPAGTLVRLHGELGAGKTTLVRGVLAGLGYDGGVRSPTFNLVHVYDTVPPVLHADLYRVATAEGLGLEDYLDDHVCLVEWAERGGPLLENVPGAVDIRIAFSATGRRVQIIGPVF